MVFIFLFRIHQYYKNQVYMICNTRVWLLNNCANEMPQCHPISHAHTRQPIRITCIWQTLIVHHWESVTHPRAFDGQHCSDVRGEGQTPFARRSNLFARRSNSLRNKVKLPSQEGQTPFAIRSNSPIARRSNSLRKNVKLPSQEGQTPLARQSNSLRKKVKLWSATQCAAPRNIQ